MPSIWPSTQPAYSQGLLEELNPTNKVGDNQTPRKWGENKQFGRHFNLTPSTVSTIFKSSDAIKKKAETVSSVQVTRTTRKRDPAMDKMETMLELWIGDQVRCRMSLSTALITAKAQSVWSDIQAKLPAEEKSTTHFGAS